MTFRATKKSDYESYLDIDLNELFGQNVPDSTDFRQSVGQDIIDTIQSRTEGGKFLAPAKKTYSPEYTHSIEFAAFNKSKNNVNLRQTGEMLDLMDIIKEDSSSIRIGWTDSEDQAKATNHNFGVTVPKREFLGLTEAEAKKIKEKYQRELDVVTSDNTTTSSVNSLQAYIRGEFGVESNTQNQGILARIIGSVLSDGES